jgi:hypothetical protein
MSNSSVFRLVIVQRDVRQRSRSHKIQGCFNESACKRKALMSAVFRFRVTGGINHSTHLRPSQKLKNPAVNLARKLRKWYQGPHLHRSRTSFIRFKASLAQSQPVTSSSMRVQSMLFFPDNGNIGAPISKLCELGNPQGHFITRSSAHSTFFQNTKLGRRWWWGVES